MSIKELMSNQTSGERSRSIAQKVKARRLELNLTKLALAKKSGVCLGTLKYFERSGKISLQSLLLLAMALRAIEDFDVLFSTINYQSIDEVIQSHHVRERQRGRLND